MPGKEHIYSYPLYYEIGFVNDNLTGEIEFILDCYKACSGKKGEKLKILDNGMGTGSYLAQFMKKGHYVSGYDLSSQMVKFAEEKLKKTGKNFSVFKGDLRDFATEEKFDLAICLNGSFQYLIENDEVLSHLKCVYNSLTEEGLYIISLPWPATFIDQPPGRIEAKWKNTRKEVEVEVDWTYQQEEIDWEDQTFSGLAQIKVTDGQKKKDLEMAYKYRLFFIQELKAISQLSGFFSFAGFFKEYGKSGKPITIKVVFKKSKLI